MTVTKPYLRKLIISWFKKTINRKITEIETEKQQINYNDGPTVNSKKICGNNEKDYAIKKLKELL
jgi:hypothetical protein